MDPSNEWNTRLDTPYPLVVGNYTGQDFEIEVAEQPLVFDEAVEQWVEDNWSKKLVQVEQDGRRMFNGQQYRLVDWNQKDGKLNLQLSMYDFKHRYGLICYARETGTVIKHDGLFVGSTVKTHDGWYVVFRLSGKSMNSNQYDVLGGMVETEVDFSGDRFLFDVLYQELEEEGGIKKDDIENSVMKMMYQGMNGQIGCYCEVVLNVARTDLETRFTDNQDQDIERLVFLNTDQYVDWLTSHNPNKQLIKKVFTGELL